MAFFADGNLRGVTHEEYVKYFGVGRFLSRRQVQALSGYAYNTVTYHLERCVQNGLLNKVVGYCDNNQPGWLYCLPETQLELPGFER